MENWNFSLQVITIVFASTGVWKLIELFFKVRLDKKLRQAETKNLHAQAEAQIVGNWISWSQHLEQRIKELEVVATENKELILKLEIQSETIDKQNAMIEEQNGVLEKQKKQIIQLEAKVKSSDKKIFMLQNEVNKLRNDAA